MVDQMDGKCPPPSVEALAKAFGIDIVMPVRCKRCVSWKPMEKNQGYCKNGAGLFRMTHEHEFCCCGKEKEDG